MIRSVDLFWQFLDNKRFLKLDRNTHFNHVDFLSHRNAKGRGKEKKDCVASEEKATSSHAESHLRTTIDKAEKADAKSAHLSDLFFRAVECAGGANEYPGENRPSSIKAMMRVYNQAQLTPNE
jgi:hypothetical protein